MIGKFWLPFFFFLSQGKCAWDKCYRKLMPSIMTLKMTSSAYKLLWEMIRVLQMMIPFLPCLKMNFQSKQQNIRPKCMPADLRMMITTETFKSSSRQGVVMTLLDNADLIWTQYGTNLVLPSTTVLNLRWYAIFLVTFKCRFQPGIHVLSSFGISLTFSSLDS